MFDMQVDPNRGIFTSIIDGDRSASQTDYNIYDPIIQKEITTLLYAGKYHKIMNLIWSTDMNKHKTPSKGLQLLEEMVKGEGIPFLLLDFKRLVETEVHKMKLDWLKVHAYGHAPLMFEQGMALIYLKIIEDKFEQKAPSLCHHEMVPLIEEAKKLFIVATIFVHMGSEQYTEPFYKACSYLCLKKYLRALESLLKVNGYTEVTDLELNSKVLMSAYDEMIDDVFESVKTKPTWHLNSLWLSNIRENEILPHLDEDRHCYSINEFIDSKLNHQVSSHI